MNTFDHINPPNDDLPQQWILILKNKNWIEWFQAFVEGRTTIPPFEDGGQGELFYVESIFQGYALGRWALNIMKPCILNLNSLEYSIAPKHFITPILDDLVNRLDNSPVPVPKHLIPSVVKEYINAKITNETIHNIFSPGSSKTNR